ncbi:Ribose ABC transport system, periplasmic ribose-binding protein RbsB [Candidatus Paraburkholderia calva]|nr:Ribose ABC transport system, periplasmic ribose-binding protein RbsB [Candidatus Paraburkholderia calva]
MAWSSARFDSWGAFGKSAGALMLCAAALAGCSKSDNASSDGSVASSASTGASASAPASAPAAAAATGGKTKIGFSIVTLNNAFFVSLKAGVEREAKTQGFDFVQTNANGDAQQQVVGTTAATDREKGFSNEIAKYPDIKVVARQEGGFDQEKSLNTMTNILQKYLQIDAVFGANDDNTVGAEKAIDNAGRYKPLGDKDHIMIIGADGTAQALSAIRSGKQDATISQNPIRMAAKSLQFIADYNAKKDVPANYAWPTMLIDKSNIDSDAVKQYGLWSEEVKQ